MPLAAAIAAAADAESAAPTAKRARLAGGDGLVIIAGESATGENAAVERNKKKPGFKAERTISGGGDLLDGGGDLQKEHAAVRRRYWCKIACCFGTGLLFALARLVKHSHNSCSLRWLVWI